MALAFVAGNCMPDLASSAHAAEPDWVSMGSTNGVEVFRVKRGVGACFVTVPQGGISCP
jgi:hypothetical protein